MTPAEARALVRWLTAAFPHPPVPEFTAQIYREQFEQLKDIDAARSAVQSVIENEHYFPPIASVLREYRPAARRNAEERARGHELEERPPDWQEQARRARDVLDRLNRSMDERAAEVWPEERDDAGSEPGREDDDNAADDEAARPKEER